MKQQIGNLSSKERMVSALLGVALPALLFRRRGPVVRAIAGAAASALVARAMAGHCGVKSAMAGHTGLVEGVMDQLRCLMRSGREPGQGLPGSPAHLSASRAIDETVEQSFPASDPPASRLADEPPANAEAKWAAAKGSH